LLGWSAYYFHAASIERHATERLQEKVDAMRAVETQMSNLRREISALDSTATPLFTAINERNFWPALWKNSTRACRNRTFGSRNWFRLLAVNRLA
jgi:hypothetical protein